MSASLPERQTPFPQRAPDARLPAPLVNLFNFVDRNAETDPLMSRAALPMSRIRGSVHHEGIRTAVLQTL
ncbi:MAG TPA: hypothetical protein PK640_12795 [Verrucomicrobiota bacterium]|nr:hypothetical protein [Verrucomicrobiota bacterium]